MAVAALTILTLAARADEGMWLPMMLKQMNEADMRARGMRLTAEQIYSVNNGSLKDAIVSFGGFCTGEVISREGLILTNHHCGYGQIQNHSAVGRNYLRDGFWAMNKGQELQNPGLTASFVVRMEDVTKPVLDAIAAAGVKTETERENAVKAATKTLIENAVKGTGYDAYVRPFFYGNEYYMFVMETFKDVRLVGAPPDGIGRFGGDTDNWMWPRHTGDFSLFRIYTAPDGTPAEYNAINVPMKPRKFLKLNLKGPKMGDFTMVMGFPGTTKEYLPSYGIENIARYTNPYKIRLRSKRLKVMDKFMKQSEQVSIQYSAKYSSIANYWKKWLGESRGLDRLDVEDKKREQEVALTAWMNADPQRKQKYGHVLPNLEKAYKELNASTLPVEYYREAVLANEILSMASGLDAVQTALDEQKDPKPAIDAFEKKIPGFYKDYNQELDMALAQVCWDAILTDLDMLQLPKEYAADKNAFGSGIHNMEFLDRMYKKSRLTTEHGAKALVADLRQDPGKTLNLEPAYQQVRIYLTDLRKRHQPRYVAALNEIDKNMRELVAAQREMQPTRKFYPDANSTLRVAYGQVQPYKPADATIYEPFTYLEGYMEKRDSTVEEFAAPRRLVELYHKKDFGNYATKDNRLPVAFIATNHTTGGNSGSPVINGDGELIGTNFDRCWEGTMSDLAYDPKLCRNIALDIRFTLWTIDKFGGAGWLLNEMELVK